MIWLKIHPEFSQIKAGTYKIEKGWNVKHALQVFVSGKEAVFSVTLVEGQRIEDWLVTLSKAPYLEQPLTPDRYDIPTPTDGDFLVPQVDFGRNARHAAELVEQGTG